MEPSDSMTSKCHNSCLLSVCFCLKFAPDVGFMDAIELMCGLEVEKKSSAQG